MKRWSVLGALLAATAFAPSFAFAQAEPTLEQRREAQMAYSRAQALRAGGQHSEAAGLYETADRLAPSVQALGNAIRAHKDCHTPDHDARAATLALQLQSRYGTDPRFATFASQVITELRASLVRVSVTCDGCEAEADGSLQPGTEFFVPPGSHRIVAHWSGGRSREHRMSNARAGVSENVTLQAPALSQGNSTVGVGSGGGDSSNTGSGGSTGSSSGGFGAGTGTGSQGSAGSSGSSGSISGSGETGASAGAGGSSGGGSAGGSSGAGAGTGDSGSNGASGASGNGNGSGNGSGSEGAGSGSGGAGDPGEGLVRPPPSRGGLHPAIFLTSLALAAGAGGALAWSGVDALNGVPAYEMAARQGDRTQAEMLLADGQGRELRTNILIGVTSGLGAVAVGTLIFTRWSAPRAEQAPVAMMIVPTLGPLPSVSLWGRF